LLLVGGLVVLLVLASTKVYGALKAQGDDQRVDLATATTVRPTTIPLVPTTAPPTLPPTTPPPKTVPPTTAPAPAILAASIVAPRPTAPQADSCQQVDTFSAKNLQDGDFSTAWRVKGNGVGKLIRLRLAAPTHITQVGLLPGWAKVDGCSGADLFRQLRTVSSVRWIFDGGKSVQQQLAATPSLQSMPVDVVTRNVTLQILGTNPPNGIDMTPISEIRLGGVPA
jgi:hypothetical protein